MQDEQSEGLEDIDWFAIRMELKHQKCLQKAASATHLMTNAMSHQCRLSLIKKHWADSYRRAMVCVVYFLAPSDMRMELVGQDVRQHLDFAAIINIEGYLACLQMIPSEVSRSSPQT